MIDSQHFVSGLTSEAYDRSFYVFAEFLRSLSPEFHERYGTEFVMMIMRYCVVYQLERGMNYE